eukprot:scaffold8080_cov417-Prasinococcus_capsulatus_cf.AAC.7
MFAPRAARYSGATVEQVARQVASHTRGTEHLSTASGRPDARRPALPRAASQAAREPPPAIAHHQAAAAVALSLPRGVPSSARGAALAACKGVHESSYGRQDGRRKVVRRRREEKVSLRCPPSPPPPPGGWRLGAAACPGRAGAGRTRVRAGLRKLGGLAGDPL